MGSLIFIHDFVHFMKGIAKYTVVYAIKWIAKFINSKIWGNKILTCGNQILTCGNNILTCGNEMEKKNTNNSLPGLRTLSPF